MATLYDTLASQGKPTDYNSRKALYESLGLNNQYGAYVGSANQNTNFMNVMLKNPSPSQAAGNVPANTGGGTSVPSSTGGGGNQALINALVSKGYNVTDATNQANSPNAANLAKEYGVNMGGSGGSGNQSGFSDIQNKYAELMQNPQDLVALYNKYAEETGYNSAKQLVTNIDKTLADVEDKINKIEPNINANVGDYLITESQRGRMVNAGELPLRTQYAQILSSRAKLAPEATAKADLVNQLMGYARQGRVDQESYLKTLMDIEQQNTSNAFEREKFEQSKIDSARTASATGSDAAWIKALTDKLGGNETPTPTKTLAPLTEADLKGQISKPLSERGLSGSVIYTAPSGVQMRWSPLDSTWIRYDADYEKQLKSIGL